MSPRRRAIVLLALAGVLGTLAASDVSRREAALRRGLGPEVGVVVARVGLPAGTALSASRLDVRRVPARYAPAQAFHRGGQVLGLHAAVAIPAGADLQPEMVRLGTGAAPAVGPPLARGQRLVPLVASGSAREIQAGDRVDVLITRDGAGATGGTTTLAVADVQVVAVAAADSDDPGPHVNVQLRVSLHQAVLLRAAQTFARDISLLVRPAGDVGAGGQGFAVGSDLRPAGS